ncbi:MAG: leucyl aminopeptidase [Thermaerobacter sp.]|nr:leucyl aminopeptidase [Thermaerobacter sp.]
MELLLHLGTFESYTGDAVVVPVFSDGELTPAGEGANRLSGGALARLRGKAFRGTIGEVLPLPLEGAGAPLALVVGLGTRADFGYAQAKQAAALAARRAQQMHLARIGLPPFGAPDGLGPQQAMEAALLGAASGAYRFDRYQKEKGEGPTAISLICGRPDGEAAARAAHSAAAAIAAGVETTRDLINMPPNEKLPEKLVAAVEAMARAEGLDCRTIGHAELEKMGAGGILAVGRGSAHPPAIVVLRHDGGKGPWHGFLGKGMTFDSGGIDLKPAPGMLWMKSDMSGAGTVVGAMRAIHRLNLPGRFIGVLSIAENMTGADAYRPSDVLKMLSGTTVEVSNTDAEGRLVLADGLELLRREKVADITDLATLTGAIVVALGAHRAGLFSNDDAHAQTLISAGEQAAERYWRMPLDPEHKEALKSPTADIKSTGSREGGASTAAEFLHHFAGDTPWVHLDIAGTAFNGESGPLGHGATGFGVETLVRFAQGG